MSTNITAINIRPAVSNREIDKTLVLSVLFSVALIMARMVYTGTLTYVFLIWNIFLGALPYFITRTISKNPALTASRFRFILVFLLWLFWMPNSFYIITDLFHLGSTPNMPRWYDLALILSCAWNGLLLGVLSVRQMEKILQERAPKISGWWFIVPVMFLNAWGVYIGRFLRFNTWDIVSNPFVLMADILDMLVHPVENRYAWGMVLCYSVMMGIMYLTLKQLSRAIR
ncbi:MAG: DUF1361 domain-containing protein [Pseudobacter sp.]|uniref:DUF1361 domain-containing protein n=1 Tax=Pseudobacter sp. TaxID=2045420 RepID=UPI003F7D5C2D